MKDFFIAIGEKRKVDEVSLEKIEQFCGLISSSCHVVKRQISSRPELGFVGIQLAELGTDISMDRNSNKQVFMKGDIYGDLGTENDTLYSHEESANFLLKNNQSANYFPDSFEGDCSFATVDLNNGELRVCNNSQGYHRLFYYKSPGLLIISSRLKLILSALERPWQINPLAARIFLINREPRWPLSIVNDIYMLPPVHCIEGDSKRFNIFSYWKPVSGDVVDRAQLVSCLKSRYTKSIRRKLTNRNVALMLSGGVDSTCLLKLCSQMNNDNFKAVSLGYDVNSEGHRFLYDETDYAKGIADHYNVPFERYIIKKEELKEMLPKIPCWIDQPGLDPSSYFILCKLAKEQGVDTIISGMGGDACFAPKKNILRWDSHYNKLSILKKIPLSKEALLLAAKMTNGRGGLFISDAFFQGPAPCSPFELFEKIKSYVGLKFFKEILGCHIMDDLNYVSSMRSNVFDAMRGDAGSSLEWCRNFALWGNPDEYHAAYSTSQLNLDLAMPFMDVMAAEMIISNAAKEDITNRNFEMEVFGGIPKELLVPFKSGFSWPYEFWAKDILAEDIEAISYETGWGNLGIDLSALRQYFTAYKDPEKNAVWNRTVTSFFWRLVMLKNYTQVNNIII